MSELEAVSLMRACKPLALRLVDTGVSLELSATERIALRGFERVRRTGFNYLKLKSLAETAGLSPGDLGMLNWACNQQSTYKLLSEVPLPPSQLSE